MFFENFPYPNGGNGILLSPDIPDRLRVVARFSPYLVKPDRHVRPWTLVPRLLLNETPFLGVRITLEHFCERLVRERTKLLDPDKGELVRVLQSKCSALLDKIIVDLSREDDDAPHGSWVLNCAVIDYCPEAIARFKLGER